MQVRFRIAARLGGVDAERPTNPVLLEERRDGDRALHLRPSQQILRPWALRRVRDGERPLRLQHEVAHFDQEPPEVPGAVGLRPAVSLLSLTLVAGEKEQGRLAAEQPSPEVEDHVAQHFVTEVGHDAVEGAKHRELVLMLVVLGNDMLDQRVHEVGGFHDARLGNDGDRLHRPHQVVRMHRERPRQLVDSRKIGFGNGEWLADQPAQQMSAVADRDDQVADLGAVVPQLGLIAVGRRR